MLGGRVGAAWDCGLPEQPISHVTIKLAFPAIDVFRLVINQVIGVEATGDKAALEVK